MTDLAAPVIDRAAQPRERQLRRISNSEVASWLSCRQRYYWSFVMNLRAKQMGSPLNKGNLVHAALEARYKGMLEGKPQPTCTLEGEQVLTKALSLNANMKDVLEARRIYTGYCGYYDTIEPKEWEIIGVEVEMDLPINDEFSMPLRYDLTVRERKTGATILVDHKTCYDFWTPEAHALNPQFPKYIGAFKYNGLPVDYAVLNEIRTRALKDPTTEQLFRRTKYVPSKARVGNALRQHIIVSREITSYRNLPVETQEALATPVLNKMVCKFCDFKDVCMAKMDGGSYEYALQTDFVVNDYGYNNESHATQDEMEQL